MAMDLQDALDIVYDLASENMIDFREADGEEELMNERVRQREAIDLVVFMMREVIKHESEDPEHPYFKTIGGPPRPGLIFGS